MDAIIVVDRHHIADLQLEKIIEEEGTIPLHKEEINLHQIEEETNLHHLEGEILDQDLLKIGTQDLPQREFFIGNDIATKIEKKVN